MNTDRSSDLLLFLSVSSAFIRGQSLLLRPAIRICALAQPLLSGRPQALIVVLALGRKYRQQALPNSQRGNEFWSTAPEARNETRAASANTHPLRDFSANPGDGSQGTEVAGARFCLSPLRSRVAPLRAPYARGALSSVASRILSSARPSCGKVGLSFPPAD
jgi:hypothetical protein